MIEANSALSVSVSEEDSLEEAGFVVNDEVYFDRVVPVTDLSLPWLIDVPLQEFS